jgi:hypothetical protein
MHNRIRRRNIRRTQFRRRDQHTIQENRKRTEQPEHGLSHDDNDGDYYYYYYYYYYYFKTPYTNMAFSLSNYLLRGASGRCYKICSFGGIHSCRCQLHAA